METTPQIIRPNCWTSVQMFKHWSRKLFSIFSLPCFANLAVEEGCEAAYKSLIFNGSTQCLNELSRLLLPTSQNSFWLSCILAYMGGVLVSLIVDLVVCLYLDLHQGPWDCLRSAPVSKYKLNLSWFLSSLLSFTPTQANLSRQFACLFLIPIVLAYSPSPT